MKYEKCDVVMRYMMDFLLMMHYTCLAVQTSITKYVQKYVHDLLIVVDDINGYGWIHTLAGRSPQRVR